MTSVNKLASLTDIANWRRWVIPLAILCVVTDAALVRFTAAGHAAPWLALGMLGDAMLSAPLFIALAESYATRSPWRMARNAMFGLAFASLILSAETFPGLARLRWIELAVGACLELWLAGLVLRFILGSDLPADEALQRAIARVLGTGRVARIVTAEMLIWYFALFSWRRSASAVASGRTFSHGTRDGGNGTMMAFACISVLEIVPIHFVVRIWSHGAAWIVTALSLYGAIWLVGEYRAARLRPTVLGPAVLHIRIGLVLSGGEVDIPRRSIARAFLHRGKIDTGAPGVLQRVSVGAEPNLCLELNEAMAVPAHLGPAKLVRKVYLALDEPQTLIDALALE